MEQSYIYHAPIGELWLRFSGEKLTKLSFRIDDAAAIRPVPDGAARAAFRQLDEYFAGTRTAFDLPYALKGTPFEMRVWDALLHIPYGETRSYGEIALQAGSPRGARAVGAANHANPLPIIVPCHRVILAGGRLGGYGGGVETKRALLALEQNRQEKHQWDIDNTRLK